MRTVLLALAAFIAASCGGTSSLTTPSSQTWRLTGTVASTTAAPLEGAVMSIVDGSNLGTVVVTDTAGRYTFLALKQGGFSVRVTMNGYATTAKGVTLTGDRVLDFALEKMLTAVLVNFDDGRGIDGVLLPDGTYSFPAVGANTGDGCASAISGTSTLTAADRHTVAVVDWTLPTGTIVQPAEHFRYDICCLTRDQAVASSKYTTRFTFTTVPCQ